MRVPILWLELSDDGLFEIRRLRSGEETRRVLVRGNGFNLRGDIAEQVELLNTSRLGIDTSRRAVRWALRLLRDAADVSG